jgi:hypothetical protein
MADPSDVPPPTVLAEALVVPGSTVTSEEEVNNLSADSRLHTDVYLSLLQAADGGPLGSAPERVRLFLPNWLRVVLGYAGTSNGPASELPPEIRLLVAIDATTRRIVDVDLARAEAQLAPYREVGRRYWLESEAPLAGVRGLVQVPGDAVRGVRGLVSSWRDAARGLRDDARAQRAETAAAAAEGRPVRPTLGAPAWTPEEAEQARRTAVTLRARLQLHPKEHERLRSTALQLGPASAREVRVGHRHPVDFEHWLMVQETSGVLSADEAAQLRHEATPPS